MEIDKRILSFIKKIRRRLWLRQFIVRALTGGIIGFLIGMGTNLASIWFPIYNADKYSLIIGITGILMGLAAGIYKLPDMQKAALTGDLKGMKERLVTAFELIGKEDIMSRLQKEDTVSHTLNFSIHKNIPLRFPWKRAAIFLSAICICTGIGFIPSQAKEKAIAYHQLKEIAEEQEDLIEEVKEELKKEELTELQQAKLQEMLDMAVEELSKMEASEELEKIMERLDVKLEKEKQADSDQSLAEAIEMISESLELPSDSLQNEQREAMEEMLAEALKEINSDDTSDSMSNEELADLAEQLADLAEKGDLSEQALEELAGDVNMSSQQMQQALADARASLSKAAAGQLADAGDSKNSGDSSEKNDKSAGDNGQNNDGDSNNQSGGGNGEGNGEGSGEGQGDGGGAGDEGSGNGGGQGGSGTGSGWNKGSKKGFEKAQGEQNTAKMLEIPDRDLGEDENLSGSSKDSGNSYTTDGKESLAWSGKKVEYGQVIQDYTDRAYSRIQKSSVPESMKDMVKRYFSDLNE